MTISFCHSVFLPVHAAGLEEGDELLDGTGAADGCRGGPVKLRQP
jgi:hypothetical protein